MAEFGGVSVGIWVSVVVVIFVLGNVMGLKPKAGELRLGDMRFLARKLDLNPKLVAQPDWLTTQAKQTGKKGMIAQYTLIDDEWRLPVAKFVIKEGVWQGVGDLPKQFQALHGRTLEQSLAPFVSAVVIKANCVSVYWRDEAYIKHFAIRDDGVMTKVEQDLYALKQWLRDVAMGLPT